MLSLIHPLSVFPNRALNFEVWDRDNRWNDNLLGKGSITPQRGMSVTQMFKLKHGTLYASLSVVCGPSLKGAFCDQYAPSPGSQGRLSYVHDWDRKTEMLTHPLPGFSQYPEQDLPVNGAPHVK